MPLRDCLCGAELALINSTSVPAGMSVSAMATLSPGTKMSMRGPFTPSDLGQERHDA